MPATRPLPRRVVRYAKAEVTRHPAHPSIAGFPLEHYLRSLANDPANPGNVRELAKVALTGGGHSTFEDGNGKEHVRWHYPQGKPEALWGLHDALQEANHPTVGHYRLMSAADKLVLDQHTHKALQESADEAAHNHHDPYIPGSATAENGYRRELQWWFTPEHHASRAFAAMTAKGNAERAATEQHRPVLDFVRQRVARLSPHSTPKDIDESIARHHVRSQAVWNERHDIPMEPFKQAALGPAPEPMTKAGGPHYDALKATRYRRLAARLRLARAGVVRRYSQTIRDLLASHAAGHPPMEGLYRDAVMDTGHPLGEQIMDLAASKGLSEASAAAGAMDAPELAHALLSSEFHGMPRVVNSWRGDSGRRIDAFYGRTKGGELVGLGIRPHEYNPLDHLHVRYIPDSFANPGSNVAIGGWLRPREVYGLIPHLPEHYRQSVADWLAAQIPEAKAEHERHSGTDYGHRTMLSRPRRYALADDLRRRLSEFGRWWGRQPRPEPASPGAPSVRPQRAAYEVVSPQPTPQPPRARINPQGAAFTPRFPRGATVAPFRGQPPPTKTFAQVVGERADRHEANLRAGKRTYGLPQTGLTPPPGQFGAKLLTHKATGNQYVVVAHHDPRQGVRQAVFGWNELAQHAKNKPELAAWMAKNRPRVTPGKVVGTARFKRRYARAGLKGQLVAAALKPIRSPNSQAGTPPHKSPDVTALGALGDHLQELGSPLGVAISHYVNNRLQPGPKFQSLSGETADEAESDDHRHRVIGRHGKDKEGNPLFWVSLSEWRPVHLDTGYTRYDKIKSHEFTVPADVVKMSRRRYAANRTDFLNALRQVRASNQVALKKSAEDIAAKLGLTPAVTLDALHDTPAGSVPGVLQALYGRMAPEQVHAAASWIGLLGNSPGVAVFHPRPNGPDRLWRMRQAGGGHEIREKLDRAGITSRVLIPHRTGFDVIIPDRGSRLARNVRGYAQQHGVELQGSQGYLKAIGSQDQAQARETYRNTVASAERQPIQFARRVPASAIHPEHASRFSVALPQHVTFDVRELARQAYGSTRQEDEAAGQQGMEAMNAELAGQEPETMVDPQTGEVRQQDPRVPLVRAREQRPDLLPILADALQDAGMTDESFLESLREPLSQLGGYGKRELPSDWSSGSIPTHGIGAVVRSLAYDTPEEMMAKLRQQQPNMRRVLQEKADADEYLRLHKQVGGPEPGYIKRIEVSDLHGTPPPGHIWDRPSRRWGSKWYRPAAQKRGAKLTAAQYKAFLADRRAAKVKAKAEAKAQAVADSLDNPTSHHHEGFTSGIIPGPPEQMARKLSRLRSLLSRQSHLAGR